MAQAPVGQPADAAASAPRRSPSELARESIRMLAQRRIVPTPENYARLWAELGGDDSAAGGVQQWLKALAREWRAAQPQAAPGALERAFAEREPERARAAFVAALSGLVQRDAVPWAAIVRELLERWNERSAEWTAARKRESLEHVLAAFGADAAKLGARLQGLAKAWSGAAVERSLGAADGIAPPAQPEAAAAALRSAPPPAAGEAMLEPLKGLIGDLLDFVAARLPSPEAAVVQQVRRIREALRAAPDLGAVLAERRAVQELCARLEPAGNGEATVLRGLLGLVRQMTANIEDLAPDRGWVRGQVERLRRLIEQPLDERIIAEAAHMLGEVATRQRGMKRELDQATATLKDMLALFVSRLGAMSASTGGFEARLQGYGERVRGAADIAQISEVIAGMLEDTRGVQAEMGRARDELGAAHAQAQQAEARVRELERQLAEVSDLMREDPLTGALNRRGLEDAWAIECARCERAAQPLSVALLDIDNFKRLNDAHGHAAGDQALQHLATIVRETIRPTDILARWGGEEFVILLPGADLVQASEAMGRVQRQLTRRFFLHNNERLLITFSAGVAGRGAGETREAVLARADAALYEAKRAGKNRVVVGAEPVKGPEELGGVPQNETKKIEGTRSDL